MRYIEQIITDAIMEGIENALFESKRKNKKKKDDGKSEKKEEKEPKHIDKWFEKYFTLKTEDFYNSFLGETTPLTYWQAKDGGYRCHFFNDGEYTGEMRMIFNHKMKKCTSVDGLPIGFSEDEQKWYGWTNRGCCGFGIGDKFRECFPVGTQIGKKCKTLEDCKKAAIAFAKSVA